MLLLLALLAASCGDSEPQRPTPTPRPTTTPGATPIPPSTGSADPPGLDRLDLARRYRGVADPRSQVQLSPPVIGQDEEFHIVLLSSDPDEPPDTTTITATLRATSEHAYFFFQDEDAVPQSAIDDAVQAFEAEVWPVVTSAFGLPAVPGVDGDPRIVILHADIGSASGYVSGVDAFPTEVIARSNQRELIYLNLSLKPLGSAGYNGILAHELQHLIHQRHDAGEEGWVNEGLSEVAGNLVNAGSSSFSAFLDRPDTQLNAWTQGTDSGAHYGASSLFFHYLLEQTGGHARDLAAEPADGIAGIEAFLAASGDGRSFAQLVGDWAVANFLDRPDGPYGYRDRAVSAASTDHSDGLGNADGEVSQFAADYPELDADDFSGAPVFVFDGAQQVPQVAALADADSDGALWWSNRGDSIDATLTRELDLTSVDQATLTFRAWFDIERWYDYGYVAISQDDGETWTALAGGETRTDDAIGVSFGPGYTGRSGGGDTPRWLDERIDLSDYAGARILLRFEYITDDAVSGPGWALDDIAVPEIGFFDGGEADVGGWRFEGFQRLTEPLPQRFELRLITLGPAPAVEAVALDARNRARIPLTGLGSDYSSAIIVIVATTPGTTEPGRYQYEVTEPT